MKRLDNTKFLPHFTKLGIDVNFALQKYPEATYVGQFPLKVKSKTDDHRYTDWPADVFYVALPDVEKGHSNYFALYVQDGSAYITDAQYVEKMLLTVYTDQNGDYIYSRYGHDYRTFGDYMCDGGWWIEIPEKPGFVTMRGRCGGPSFPRSKAVIVKDGEFYELNLADAYEQHIEPTTHDNE